MPRSAAYGAAILALLLALQVAPCRATGARDKACPTTEQLLHYTGAFPITRWGEVALVNGAGNSDPTEDGKWDFSHSIVSVDRMRPEPGVSFWLVNVDSSHLLGSGAFGTLLSVSCKHGHLRVIPQSGEFLSGAKVRILSGREFTTRSGYWVDRDARCCPSKVEIRHYRWDSARQTFLVTQRQVKNQ